MNIVKALEHFKWKCQNSWKPTKRDIEAFNAIVEYKELQEIQAMSENESLAKLWIHQLMILNNTELYSAEQAIQAIDEILDKPVYFWVQQLHKNIGLMNLNAKFINHPEYIEAVRKGNILKMYESTKEIVDKHGEEILKILKKDVKEENIIKFVNQNINRILNKYDK